MPIGLMIFAGGLHEFDALAHDGVADDGDGFIGILGFAEGVPDF